MKLSALLAPPVRASHHDEIMMSGANHQAPFGIACFHAAACGDGATGSGSVARAAVAHCPAALCVISYRPPLRVRLAVGDCCARRCRPIFLDSSVEGGRVRFLRGVRRSGKCCAIYGSDSEVRAAVCRPADWFCAAWAGCREGRPLPAAERRFSRDSRPNREALEPLGASE